MELRSRALCRSFEGKKYWLTSSCSLRARASANNLAHSLVSGAALSWGEGQVAENLKIPTQSGILWVPSHKQLSELIWTALQIEKHQKNLLYSLPAFWKTASHCQSLICPQAWSLHPHAVRAQKSGLKSKQISAAACTAVWMHSREAPSIERRGTRPTLN